MASGPVENGQGPLRRCRAESQPQMQWLDMPVPGAQTAGLPIPKWGGQEKGSRLLGVTDKESGGTQVWEHNSVKEKGFCSHCGSSCVPSTQHQKVCPCPKPQDLWMGSYLEVGSLQSSSG